ncbi:unnamed protein product [Effrenium voratum]|uniref:Uncharacterized protein n=1 Tax=Effrenium voratum TaxID=2562239 RepID=A0AA36J4M9_9DINO|nr:unnamed protein product [Effrenium voratum]
MGMHFGIVHGTRTGKRKVEGPLRVSRWNFKGTNLAVCFAFEEREVEAQDKARELQEEYAGEFAFITAAYHPPNMPGHVPGKSSNECWAFQVLAKELRDQRGYEVDDPRVVITVIDDDSELHENYFEGLTYHYLKAKESDRYLTMWQPPIVHFKNFLSQPWPQVLH